MNIKVDKRAVAEASQKIGTAIYAQSQQAAGESGQTAGASTQTGASGDSASADEDVVDAEIVDEDEKK